MFLYSFSHHGFKLRQKASLLVYGRREVGPPAAAKNSLWHERMCPDKPPPGRTLAGNLRRSPQFHFPILQVDQHHSCLLSLEGHSVGEPKLMGQHWSMGGVVDCYLLTAHRGFTSHPRSDLGSGNTIQVFHSFWPLQIDASTYAPDRQDADNFRRRNPTRS